MLTEWRDIIATARTSFIRIYIAWVQPLSVGIRNAATQPNTPVNIKQPLSLT